jgi:sRNA-binding regulator protein Hfq
MAFLAGLNDYLLKNYRHSTFEEVAATGAPCCLHLHGHTTLQGTLAENSAYDIVVIAKDGARYELPKTRVKMLYPAEFAQAVQAQLTVDADAQARQLQPIVTVKQRYFVKNKTIYTLMRSQEELLITLLEGEVLKGLIHSFSRYEMSLVLKDGTLVAVLRHAILDIRDTSGRCYLKSSQQILRDWIRSELYIDPRPRSELRPGLKKVKIKRRKKVIIR